MSSTNLRLADAPAPALLARVLLCSSIAALATSSALGQQRAIREPFARDAVTVDEMRERAQTQPFVRGEVVVALELPGSPTALDGRLRGLDWAARTGAARAGLDRTLLSFARTPNVSVALVLVDLRGADVFGAMRALATSPDVLWSAPNFYSPLADPRDLVPNDPMYGSQYHHPLMENDDAWDITLGDGSIVIGVTDDGVDIDHEDLIANVWTNSGETPGDGFDNDSNGYVDDVNGWDFVFDNNDPNPDSSGDDHGTHVAGIAGARTDNATGVAGTAGRCTILPLQFFASGQLWTAANIAETFAYSVDNGAQITTTSYNINGWVGDPVFTAGLQYLYDQGGMHFNSAGNGSELNPVRQAFEQTFLTINTDSNDVKSSSSNYGIGCDVCAPGSSILATEIGDTYGEKSGTSMASPNAAAVAALIWSQNPSWTREQVAAQLMATADDVDSANPGLEGLLGAGRVNSHRALTETIGAPQVESLGGLTEGGGSFEVEFDQIMEPSTVNDSANYEVRESGADGVFDTGDDDVRVVTPAKTYMLSTNQMELDVGGPPLGLGDYRLTLFSGGLTNPFGTGLDGDGDGSGGDDFVFPFQIGPAQVAPAGSLTHRWSTGSSIDTNGEVDGYNIKLDPGQTLSVLVEAEGGLVPAVEVRDSIGNPLATGVPVGSSQVVQGLAIDTAGLYEVAVSGSGGTTGPYALSILLNALFEEEAAGGVANESSAAAEDLEAGAIVLGVRPAARLAALGHAGFGEDFESGSVGSDWALTSSVAEGRIQISSEFGAANGTTYAMVMDRTPSGDFNLNEAVWTIDLSSISAPFLNFHHAEWNDEEDPLPASFSGSANGDGVSISEDGTNWHRIYDPASQSSGVWQSVAVDLAAAASGAGISLGRNFRIKFQQYDNFPLTTDGRGYDEIAITSAVGFDDWYGFELADAQTATLGVASLDPMATVGLELYARNGTTLLATGVATANLSSAIAAYRDSTTDGSKDKYYARVTVTGGEYDLVVTRSAGFDLESNDTPPSAQNLTGRSGVLGHVESGSDDYYRFHLTPGEKLALTASLPAEGPFQFANGLATDGGSALRLELRDPDGDLVASGTAGLEHVAAMSGDHVLRVYGDGGASGEYVLSRPVLRPRVLGQ